MLVDDWQKYYLYKKSIAEYAGHSVALLAITNNTDLYFVMREDMVRSDGITLVAFSQNKRLNFNDAKPYLAKSKRIVLISPYDSLTRDELETLIQDSVYWPKAGVIVAKGKEIMKLDNVYADKPNPVPVETDTEFAKFDVASECTCITQYQNFMDFNFEHGLYKYTLELRKKGYENYIDKNLIKRQ